MVWLFPVKECYFVIFPAPGFVMPFAWIIYLGNIVSEVMFIMEFVTPFTNKSEINLIDNIQLIKDEAV